MEPTEGTKERKFNTTKLCHAEPKTKNPYGVLCTRPLSTCRVMGMLREAKHDIAKDVYEGFGGR